MAPGDLESLPEMERSLEESGVSRPTTARPSLRRAELSQTDYHHSSSLWTLPTTRTRSHYRSNRSPTSLYHLQTNLCNKVRLGQPQLQSAPADQPVSHSAGRRYLPCLWPTVPLSWETHSTPQDDSFLPTISGFTEAMDGSATLLRQYHCTGAGANWLYDSLATDLCGYHLSSCGDGPYWSWFSGSTLDLPGGLGACRRADSGTYSTTTMYITLALGGVWTHHYGSESFLRRSCTNSCTTGAGSSHEGPLLPGGWETLYSGGCKWWCRMDGTKWRPDVCGLYTFTQTVLTHVIRPSSFLRGP